MHSNQTTITKNQIETGKELNESRDEKQKNENNKNFPSCITSVISRPAFKHLRIKTDKDLKPPKKWENEEYGFNITCVAEKREIEKEADEIEVHDFSKAEWNMLLEQEFSLDDEHSTPLCVSSSSDSDWTETSGDSENIEFYDTTSADVFDPATKVLQKYWEDQEQFWFMCSVIPRNNEQPMSEEETLLPPRNPKDTRKTLVLDLDETLVHCFFGYEENAAHDWNFQLDTENGLFDVFCLVRPHLEEFLKECAKMFELVLFTASQDNYANKVLDHIDPSGYIQHRLFRRHCTKVRGNFVKDLSRLGRKLDQTIIIDNSPLTFAFQPLNGIPCNNWFGDQMDQELLQLLPILRHLKAAEDVRDDLAGIYYVGLFLSELRYSLAMTEESDWMPVCAEKRYFNTSSAY